MTTCCPAAAESTRRFWSPVIASALFGIAVSTGAPSALADDATAEALFKAGKSLMEQKKYAEACPKLEASYKLDPATGTKLNIADCHEKEGKIAQAWGEWGEARDQAKRENDKARMELAIRRQKELEPRVPKLTINVTGNIEGLAVFRDDLQLESAMFGVPLPVDPGAHVVTLRRGKSVLREEKVESKEKATDEVTIDATGIPAPTPEESANSSSSDGQTKPVMVRRSKGMIAGGVILSTFGAFTTLGGVGVLAGTRYTGAGLAVFLLGAGMTTGGIILAVKGAKKVPKPVTTQAFTIHEPQFLLGPTSVGFQGKF